MYFCNGRMVAGTHKTAKAMDELTKGLSKSGRILTTRRPCQIRRFFLGLFVFFADLFWSIMSDYGFFAYYLDLGFFYDNGLW